MNYAKIVEARRILRAAADRPAPPPAPGFQQFQCLGCGQILTQKPGPAYCPCGGCYFVRIS